MTAMDRPQPQAPGGCMFTQGRATDEECRECNHACCRRARRYAPFSPRPNAASSRPRTPGASARGGAKDDFAHLATRLPVGQDRASATQRKQLFEQIDLNGNGFLSLAEVDRGVRDVIRCEALFRAKPVMMRAFQAAKDAVQSKAKSKAKAELASRYVERGEEFRLLLLYLRRYFELLGAFRAIDASSDQRVDIDEFVAGCATLPRFGIEVKDPRADFARIDVNGGGMILFDEFAHLAIDRHVAGAAEGERATLRARPRVPNLAGVDYENTLRPRCASPPLRIRSWCQRPPCAQARRPARARRALCRAARARARRAGRGRSCQLAGAAPRRSRVHDTVG